MKDFELTLPKVEETMNSRAPTHSLFAQKTYKDIEETFLACALGLTTFSPTRPFWTQTKDSIEGNFSYVYINFSISEVYARYIGICPILVPSSKLYEKLLLEATTSNLGIPQVVFGEYPKFLVSTSKSNTLTQALMENKLKTTGKIYTFDEIKHTDIITPFKPVTYEEYEYQDEKFINLKCPYKIDYETSERVRRIQENEYVWVRVAPLLWLVNEEEKKLMSRDIILAGIQFNSGLKYDGNFAKSNIKWYLDTYMSKEILPKNYKPLSSSILDKDEDLQKVMLKKIRKN